MLNLPDLDVLHTRLQPIMQPVVSSALKQSMWQLRAIVKESMVHRGVGGASVPSGRGVGLSSWATTKQIAPTKKEDKQVIYNLIHAGIVRL